ncbi:hypothetical protein GCM10009647_051110 [Streptomyces sanglieri]
MPARLDLHGVVVTADAMHTQRGHADKIAVAEGHYVLVVKGNRKDLRTQLRDLPWDEIPLRDRSRRSGHGRREVRRLKACTVRLGLLFPHAVQAMEIKLAGPTARRATVVSRETHRSPYLP